MKPKSISKRRRLATYEKALKIYSMGDETILHNMGHGLCQLLRTIYLKQKKFTDSYSHPEYWIYYNTPSLFPEIKDIIKKLKNTTYTAQQEIDIRIEGLIKIIAELTK